MDREEDARQMYDALVTKLKTSRAYAFGSVSKELGLRGYF